MEPDILTGSFVLKLSKGIDPADVPPANLSIHLGFTRAEGNCAAIGGNVFMNPRKPIEDLIFKYIMKHGKKSDSALNLRKIFLEHDMRVPADVIKAELEKNGIPVPQDPPVSSPSPSGTPETGPRICQTGSSQTINASENANVKDNIMTGSVANMTINNYAAGASTSQGKG